MPPPLIGGGIKRCFYLTSVAYIGPKSKTERPRKTKIGREVAHVTCDWTPISRSKGQSHQATLLTAVCWRVRQLQRWAWEHVGREKLLLRCRLPGRARRLGAHGGEERGRGISWRPPAYSLLLLKHATCQLWKKVSSGVLLSRRKLLPILLLNRHSMQ